MGSIQTQTEAVEISQAFASGVAENMILSGYDRKFREHTECRYRAQAWLQLNMVVVNKGAWNGLDEKRREIIIGAAAMAGQEVSAKTKDFRNGTKNSVPRTA